MSGYRDDDLWHPSAVEELLLVQGALKHRLADLGSSEQMAFAPQARNSLLAALGEVAAELRVLNDRARKPDAADFDLRAST